MELSVEDEYLLLGMLVIIPKTLYAAVLKELQSNHPGIARMKGLARGYVWWPNLDKDIETLAKSCQACQLVKQAPPSAPLHPWSWPTKPWQRVHIDFAGPFLNKMYFVAVNVHSKWPEVYELSQTKAAKTIAVLHHLFASRSLSARMVSNNGPKLVSEQVAAFLKANGVRHLKCIPYHPASNGWLNNLSEPSNRL